MVISPALFVLVNSLHGSCCETVVAVSRSCLSAQEPQFETLGKANVL